jgi:hypothetical protein
LGGDFEVHGGRGDDRDRVTEAFDELGVVGGGLLAAAGVGIDQKLPAENLRGLGFPEVVAGDGFGDGSVCIGLTASGPFEGAGDGGGQDGGPGFDGGGENGVDPFLHDAGAGGVVNGNVIDFGFDAFEGASDRVVAFVASFDDFDAEQGRIAAEFFREMLAVFGGNHEDCLSDIGAIHETIGRVHPDGPPIQWSKWLFIVLIAKAAALSGGGQNHGETGHGSGSDRVWSDKRLVRMAILSLLCARFSRSQAKFGDVGFRFGKRTLLSRSERRQCSVVRLATSNYIESEPIDRSHPLFWIVIRRESSACFIISR